MRLALLSLLALLALAAPAGAATPRTTLPDVEDEVMCVVCGVPLDVATEAPQAADERELIRARIAAGDTKEEIKGRLVAEYGQQVLATPSAGGFDAAAWLVPAGLGLLAVLGVGVGLPRWRRRRPAPATTTDGGPPPPSSLEARRLDEELARFDGATR